MTIIVLGFKNFQNYIFYDPDLTVLFRNPNSGVLGQPQTPENKQKEEQFNVAGVVAGVVVGAVVLVTLVLVFAIPSIRYKVFPFLNRRNVDSAMIRNTMQTAREDSSDSSEEKRPVNASWTTGATSTAKLTNT